MCVVLQSTRKLRHFGLVFNRGRRIGAFLVSAMAGGIVHGVMNHQGESYDSRATTSKQVSEEIVDEPLATSADKQGKGIDGFEQR